jgi:hypothetical protein
LCSRASEQLRRLLKARTTLVQAEVVMKNQIHALMTAEGLEDKKASLQSKKGRRQALDALNKRESGLVVQPLLESIDRLRDNVKAIEAELRALAVGDRVVELLMTIPGCGEICAWTIRAFLDDIKRFDSAKKFAAFAGLVPWVQNSNETVRHGRITKRGPEELRTALVQVVMGMRRLKEETLEWRLMERHEELKRRAGSGKSIIATARKVAVIIWHMLKADEEFNLAFMVDRKLAEKAAKMSEKTLSGEQAAASDNSGPAVMSQSALSAGQTETTKAEAAAKNEAMPQAQRAALPQNKSRKVKETGVTGKKRKKAG